MFRLAASHHVSSYHIDSIYETSLKRIFQFSVRDDDKYGEEEGKVDGFIVLYYQVICVTRLNNLSNTSS